jgi:hypothetical protein
VDLDEIVYGSDVIEVNCNAVIYNLIASTALNQLRFKLLRWMQYIYHSALFILRWHFHSGERGLFWLIVCTLKKVRTKKFCFWTIYLFHSIRQTKLESHKYGNRMFVKVTSIKFCRYFIFRRHCCLQQLSCESEVQRCFDWAKEDERFSQFK